LEDIENRIEIFRPLDVFVVIQNGELIGIIGCPPIYKEKLQYGLFYQFCKSSRQLVPLRVLMPLSLRNMASRQRP